MLRVPNRPNLSHPLVRSMFLSLVAFAIGCGGGDEPGSSTAAKKPGESPKANGNGHGAEPPQASHAPLPLAISIEELQQRISEPWLRVLDVRPAEDYEVSHVPGAHLVEPGYWKDLSLEEGGLQNLKQWAEIVGGYGISNDSGVVVYSSNPTDAARAWWILKYLGLRDVAILDGGWAAWQAAGGEVANEEPLVKAATFTPHPQASRLMQIGDLKQSLEKDACLVVDARSPGEHAGTEGDAPRKGRIPKAVHVEWKEFLGPDGKFKSPDEIKKLLADRGVAADKKVVTHCQSGGRAALDAFAIEYAGLPPAANYYRGWAEWSADDAAPIAKPE